MSNKIQVIKDRSGNNVLPITHEKAVRDSNGVSLETKLGSLESKTYVEAWDGDSTPVVANIPAGVTVTYNSTTYTGTLAASASTDGKVYLVKNGTEYDRYFSSQNLAGNYVWSHLGTTGMVLSDYATKDDLSQLEIEINGERITETIELEWEGYLRYSTTRVYKFAVGKSVAGDVISVKLNDYTTYQFSIALCETKGWSVTTGYDSGWKKQDFTYTVPSGKDGYYIRIAVARQSGGITIDEATDVITESKVSRVINYRANGLVQEIQDAQEDISTINSSMASMSDSLVNNSNELYGGKVVRPIVIGFQVWTGNGSTRLYRVAEKTVREGDRVVIKLSDYVNYKVSINLADGTSFSPTTIDIGWKTADISYVVPAGYDGQYLRLVLARADNQKIYYSNGNSVLSVAAIYRNDVQDTEGLVQRVAALDSDPRPSLLGYRRVSYMGRKINIPDPQNDCYVRFLMNLDQNGTFQGCAVFGDYLFQFTSGAQYIGVYDLAKGQMVQTVQSSGGDHANNASFGLEYYDESDPFPLLYLSTYDTKKLLVYRITGTRGAFTFTVVQTITLSTTLNGPDVNIDRSTGKAVMSGYINGTWQSAENMGFHIFTLPRVTEGDVTITDFGDRVVVPFIYASQGSDARDGILYISFGIEDTEIYAFDYKTGDILTIIQPALNDGIEPEGMGIWRDKLVISYIDKKLYEISF